MVHVRWHKSHSENGAPPDYPEYPGQPKGIKEVLKEKGLYKACLHGKCKKCPTDDNNCCNKKILGLQEDFLQQKSLVQEVIEMAGHLCIFLPKFHCKLNFIKFLWETIKKHLCDDCNYTFDTLKENMPMVLASVNIVTIH